MGASARNTKASKRQAEISDLNADPIVTDRLLKWPVVDGGYEWVIVGRDRVLTENARSRKREHPPQQLYTPADGFKLFEQFAKLEATEEAFKRFADEFGVLGLGPEVTGIPRVHVEGNVTGERYTSWWLARREVAEAWQLWNTIRTDATARMIRLEAMVNAGLEGHIATRVIWHEKRRQYVFRFFPTTLLGCMWLAFSRTALTGDAQFQQCKSCGKVIEIGKGARTASTEFCSEACRVCAYRARVKAAKELRGQKWSVKRIAAKLGTTTGTIENWLTKKK